jgi:hypothetical protein
MLKRFGHIIPWILVIVLGLLVLSMFAMYRSFLFPYPEGFDDMPPPPADPAKRMRAIHDMKTAAEGVQVESSDDMISNINAFILKAMTNMVESYAPLPDFINDKLGKIIDITDDTCFIVRSIEAKYTKQTLAQLKSPPRRPTPITQKNVKKFAMKKSQFLAEHKNADLIECFEDGGGTDISGVDISGATSYVSSLFKSDDEEKGKGKDKGKDKGKGIGDVTDISGYTFGTPKSFDDVPVKDNKEAMKKKHVEENKQIIRMKVKLLDIQTKVEAIMNTEDYKSLVAKLKKVPITAEFGSDFIQKNKAEIVEGFKDSPYKFPVPYKNSELDDTQKEYLNVLNTSYVLLTTLGNDLGKEFTAAQTTFTNLVTNYKLIDPSYRA